jgi:hypothetical protein
MQGEDSGAMINTRRRPPRWIRRIRRWWRRTPPGQVAQTLIGLGLVLLVVAALIAFAA